MRTTVLFCALVLAVAPSIARAGGDVSVERGLQVSITGGCQGCHTEGYAESEGKIDPAKAMTGSSVGWRGPWGTTYATNLREYAALFSEDSWVDNLKNLQTLPPMPWYDLRATDESDMRSLYLYIKSLGAPGAPARAALAAGKEPRTPFVTLIPPQMPAPCTSDRECDFGQVCKAGPIAQCVPKQK